MKRFTTLFMFLLVMAFASASFGLTPGSAVQSLTSTRQGEILTVNFAFTASPDDGAMPAIATSTAISTAITGMYLFAVETNPGNVAVPDAWSVTVTNAAGFDLLGGAGATRSTTLTQRVIPSVATGIYGASLVDGILYLNITGNTTPSATGSVKLFLSK